MLTYKRAYSGVKIIIVRAPRTAIMIFPVSSHHFAIGMGAFREGGVFSKFAGISGWGVKTSKCKVLSSCCGQQANFFSKMLTYKRAYSGVKIIIVRARPGPQL